MEEIAREFLDHDENALGEDAKLEHILISDIILELQHRLDLDDVSIVPGLGPKNNGVTEKNKSWLCQYFLIRTRATMTDTPV